jgi:CRP-like cAMP-binding protein
MISASFAPPASSWSRPVSAGANSMDINRQTNTATSYGSRRVAAQAIALQPLVHALSLQLNVPHGMYIQAERRTLLPGDAVFRAGETPSVVIVVERGLLLHSALSNDKNKRQPQFSLCGRGDALQLGSETQGNLDNGLLHTQFGAGNSSTPAQQTRALSYVELIVIALAEVRSLEAQVGLFSELVVSPMSVRVLRDWSLRNALALVPAAQRVALGLGELARLADQSGVKSVPGEEHVAEIAVSVADLAGWVRAPISVVDTVVRMLERQALVKTDAAHLVAIATSAVRALADAVSERVRDMPTHATVSS